MGIYIRYFIKTSYLCFIPKLISGCVYHCDRSIDWRRFPVVSLMVQVNYFFYTKDMLWLASWRAYRLDLWAWSKIILLTRKNWAARSVGALLEAFLWYPKRPYLQAINEFRRTIVHKVGLAYEEGAGWSSKRVISCCEPNRIGGPQWVVPRLT